MSSSPKYIHAVGCVNTYVILPFRFGVTFFQVMWACGAVLIHSILAALVLICSFPFLTVSSFISDSVHLCNMPI